VRSGSIIDRSRRNRYRIEIEVGLDYDTDIERAATVIEETTTEVEDVAAMPEPNAVTKRFGDSAVVLGLRYWIRNPSMRKRWRTQTAAMNAIKPALDEEDRDPLPAADALRAGCGRLRPTTGRVSRGARGDARRVPTRARTMAPPRAGSDTEGSGVGPMTGDDRDAGSGLAERRGLDEAVVYQPAEDSGLLAEAALRGARTSAGGRHGLGMGRPADRRGAGSTRSAATSIRTRRDGARERGVEGVVADLLSPYRADAFDTVCFNPLSPDRPGQRVRVGRLDGTRALGRRVGPRTHRAVPRRRGARPRAGRRRPASSLALTGYDEVLALVEDAGFAAEPVVESFPFETLTVLALRRA